MTKFKPNYDLIHSGVFYRAAVDVEVPETLADELQEHGTIIYEPTIDTTVKERRARKRA